MTGDKDYFKTFCHILGAFGAAGTRREVQTLIIDSAIQAMDGKAACLHLDRQSGVYETVAQKGLSENYSHADPVKAQLSIQSLEADGYLAFRDALTDERLENRDVKKAEGIASILTVPMRLNSSTIGALTLYTATQRDFSPSEIAFLNGLAEQGAIVIDRLRLIERMRKNAMLFLDLASAINSSLDIRDIMQSLTVNVCENLGMKGALIHLLDSENRSLKLVASHGLSEEFLAFRQSSDAETARRALKGETLIISDADTDDRIIHKEGMRREGIISMIVIPILARDEVIGVMRLYSASRRKFPSDFVAIVEAIGHQGGLAIQNGSMYLQLQESKKNLEQEIWSHRSWF